MTGTTKLHVCVVGAGIVGLASSILLRRDGHKVTVLEKDPSLHTVSYPYDSIGPYLTQSRDLPEAFSSIQMQFESYKTLECMTR